MATHQFHGLKKKNFKKSKILQLNISGKKSKKYMHQKALSPVIKQKPIY